MRPTIPVQKKRNTWVKLSIGSEVEQQLIGTIMHTLNLYSVEKEKTIRTAVRWVIRESLMK